MKLLSYLIIVSLMLIFSSCKKKNTELQTVYTYSLNQSYSGSHAKQNVNATVTVTEKDEYVTFEIEMNGLHINKSYNPHIHIENLNEPYGYSGNPVIDFPAMEDGSNTSTRDMYTVDYDDFTNNFKGFFIVHDPDNVRNDTTTLLIFGKIGS